MERYWFTEAEKQAFREAFRSELEKRRDTNLENADDGELCR